MQSGFFQAESWKLALDALRGNKLRAMLTMLGVIIGSACIVLVVTVALAGRRYIVGQIEGIGSNLVYAELSRHGVTQSDEITPADLEAVRQNVPGVIETAGTRDISMPVAFNGQERVVSLVGVTRGFQKIRNLVILRGRYFEPDEISGRNKVCLLTESLASRAFPFEDPVGRQVRVGEIYFTVIGVFRERVATFGQSEIAKDSAIVPFPLIKDYQGNDAFGTIYAQADSPEDVPAVTRGLAEVLQSRHRLGAQYSVQNLASILEAARDIGLALSVVLVGVAVIALAISGVGIMNIMLVTVTERTREIGIRKAVGAPQQAILWQFLMEALIISGTGAFAGILIAISIPLLVNFLLGFFEVPSDVHIPISWLSVVLAFVVSCSTGLLFGYLPANRAAKLHPTDSLRYE
jgi:putative ABC transport system permease protein